MLRDLLLFGFFENGNDLCEEKEVSNNFARELYITTVSSRRAMN